MVIISFLETFMPETDQVKENLGKLAGSGKAISGK